MKKTINKVEYTQSNCFSMQTKYKIIVGETPFIKVSISYGNDNVTERCFLRDRQKFLKRFSIINVDKWKEEYLNKNVLDGIQWKLSVTYGDGSKKQVYGSNSFPKGYNRLKKLFEEIEVVDNISMA